MTELVTIELKEGPVIFKNGNDAGISASHRLWADITATEFYPPGANSGGGAFYVVRLEKSVTQAKEVRPAKAELEDALLLIAPAWSFSGESDMVVETIEAVSSPRFESNADAIEHKLLGLEGVTKVVSKGLAAY